MTLARSPGRRFAFPPSCRASSSAGASRPPLGGIENWHAERETPDGNCTFAADRQPSRISRRIPARPGGVAGAWGGLGFRRSVIVFASEQRAPLARHAPLRQGFPIEPVLRRAFLRVPAGLRDAPVRSARVRSLPFRRAIESSRQT